MIKEIIFDLGGVYFEAGTRKIKGKLIEMVPASKEIVEEIFEGNSSKEGFLYRNGKITKEIFWEKAKLKLKINNSLADKIREIWYDSYKPIPGMKSLVQKLRKNYRVIAFSGNIEERIEYLDSKYGLMKDFDDFVLSYDFGCSKSDINFYKVLIKKLKCKPYQSVFIDDRQEFINIGESLGFKVVLFKNVEQVIDDLKKYKIRID